jgi:tyrosine phenol-lyase
VTVPRAAWAEPWKIKMVEPLSVTTREDRARALEEAGYNTFLLRSADVYIDLLTDSGTSAMSDRQWAGLMLGDEAYAGSRNYYHLEEVVRRRYGYRHVIPTHQGRGAENLISKALIRPGDVIPGNMYFTTTKVHQELAGGTFADIVVDEAHDPRSPFPFKGNVDLAKLEALIARHGAARIPYVSLATTVNMAGGQPISLENLRAVRALTARHGIRIIHDMTRVAENAYMIQRQEPGQAHRTVAEIVHDLCALTDGAVFEEARNLVVIYEGLQTYGGLAGRDMEAMAIGIEESLADDHIRARVGQVLYLGDKLVAAGIPVVRPIGTHGVFLDAQAFLPHLPQDAFPAQALAAELYLESGVRAMERGIVSAGRDKDTGEHCYPALELVRLTIPRRVYTQAHMDVVAEAVARVWARRAAITGLTMTYEPRYLRFFQARFAPRAAP